MTDSGVKFYDLTGEGGAYEVVIGEHRAVLENPVDGDARLRWDDEMFSGYDDSPAEAQSRRFRSMGHAEEFLERYATAIAQQGFGFTAPAPPDDEALGRRLYHAMIEERFDAYSDPMRPPWESLPQPIRSRYTTGARAVRTALGEHEAALPQEVARLREALHGVASGLDHTEGCYDCREHWVKVAKALDAAWEIQRALATPPTPAGGPSAAAEMGEVARLRSALEQYGEHPPECRYPLMGANDTCTCGLLELIATPRTPAGGAE